VRARGTGGDAALLAVAEELGCRLTTLDLGRGTLLTLLAEVVDTVAGQEIGAEPEEGEHG
jgi:hypothetical protein